MLLGEKLGIVAPDKGATLEEWEQFLDAEKSARAVEKRKRTLALEHADPYALGSSLVTCKGKGGVYRSQSLVGFTGDAEKGTSQVDPAVEATQDRDIEIARFDLSTRRGSKSRGRAARQRAARKAHRK